MSIECIPYPVAEKMLALLVAELPSTHGGAADRTFVCGHGDPAIEFCARGTAYVGIRGVRPRTGKGCGNVWTLDLEMGVYRCYPVTRDNGPPTEAQVEASARDVSDDLLAMARVVDAARRLNAAMLSLLTIAPRGGVHGSKALVTVDVTMSGPYLADV